MPWGRGVWVLDGKEKGWDGESTVVELQSLQRGVGAFDNVFPRKASVVDGIVAIGATPIDLG